MTKSGYTYILLLFIILFSASETCKCQSIRSLDRDLLHKINRLDGPFITGYCNVMSSSAAVVSIGVPASMFLYSLYNDDPDLLNTSIYIGASVATSFIASYILKDVFDRNRPYQSYPSWISANSTESSSSFPSSHSAVSFALATSLSLEYPKWYIIAPSYFWAASVGFSRIQKGVHYPSDVVAGALLGAGSAFLCYELNQWWFGSKKKRPDTSWISHVYDVQ